MKSLMSPIPPSSSTQMMSQKTSTAATSSSGTVTMTSISATTDSPSTSTSRRVQQQQHQQQQQATMKAATTTTNTQTSLQASALAKQEVNSSCSDAAVAAGGNNTPIASSPDTNGVVIKTEEKDCDDNGSLASSSTSPSTMGDGVATDNEAISNESFIHARPRPILLSAVNPHITCNLCHGYLIDATTIVECLHSFCHSCLIKHLRTEKYCPRCEMMINTAKPNIKPDTTLQAIVYKLVPGLYEKELMRKRAFYKDRPAEAALATPEQRGEDTEQLIFGPADNMSLSLEYADIEELIGAGANGRDFSELRKPRYLQCPAMYTVAHLKKFVHGKFSIDSQRFGIDIMYKVKTIILLDHYTLMDVAYIYTWKRDAPMRFYFRVKESAAALRRFQQNRLRRSVAQVKREPSEEQQRLAKSSSYSGPMTIVHVASAAPATAAAKESPSPPSTTEIKKEKEDEAEQQQQHQATSKAPVAGHRPKSSKSSSSELKHFAVVPYNGGANASTPKSGDLKITLVSKQSPKEAGMAVKTPIYATAAQMSNSLTSKNQDPYAFETNNNVAASAAAAANHHKDRKVENIKLKIDLSRQNSVTIINSCSPSSGGGKRKDSSKDKDKEWKVKTSKKDKDKDYGKTAGGKSNAYLTVPPLTIKAERINSSSASAKSPSLGKNQGSPKTRSSMPSRISPPALSPPEPRTEEEKKSLFLKSVALVPISKGTSPQEGSKTPSPPKSPSSSVAPPPLFKIPASVPAPSKSSHATLGGSKRKNSEPMKAPVAAKKAKPSSPTLPNYNMDFKIRLPARPFTSSTASTASPVPMSSTTTTTTATSTAAHQTTTTASAFSSPSTKDKPLMPPPSAPVGSMKPPQAPSTSNASWSRPKTPKNVGQNQRVAGGLPGLTPLSPHPLYGGNAGSSLGGNGLVQPSPPGNRTPIAKRYQPILPKAARPNPFANIPCDVNQILKNAGTEIKTINEPKSLTPILPKVYGPKGDAGSTHSPQQQQSQQQQQQQQRVMGPPKAPVAKMPAKAPANSSPGNHQQRGGTAAKLNTGGHTPSTIASSNSNNYRNLALYNSSKSRGNDAPPGYRTPIYTPNSPIYSPSSPQYSPNFSIPTVPMYKYTPKPSNSPTSSSSSSSTSSSSSSSSSSPSAAGSNSSGGGTSYLQSILSTNPSMANLFPSPPVQKDSPKSNSPPVASDLSAGNNNNNKGPTHHHHQQQQQHQTTAAPKRVYPFARSPSPCGSGADEPAEKQSMKSLLNSCNINIPSSLSITITREDSESPSNSGSYPKRKSPVNNYIEILKLPDQQQVAPAAASGSGAANEAADTKRSSPPMQKVGTLLGQPQSISMLATRDKAEEKQPSPPTGGGGGGTSVTSQQQHVARKAVPVSTATMPMAPPASGPSMMLNGGTTGKQQQQQQQQKKPQQQQQATSSPGGAGKLTTGTMATTPAAGHFNKASSPVTNSNNNNGNSNSSGKNVVKASAKSPTATTTTTTTTPSTSPTANTQQQQQNNPQTVEKRTPSPEKKAGASGNTPGGNKSPNEQPGAKKFRPILPRQIPTPIPEVIPPKVTSANIIGTYSSPSGVAVKVHAHKKLPIPKVSPTGATGNNTTSGNASTAQQQQHSPNGSSKPQNLVSASALSPPVKVSTGLNLATSSAAATPNSGTPPTVTAAAASKAKARISKAATPPPSIASSATFTKPPGSPPNTVSSKFMPPPPSPLSVMPPPSMPPPSLTAAAAAAAQANDLSKLYRVQQAVAAAAAAQNPSNMLYSYAAAAAQMGLQFPGANLFGYPQALLMGQLSRMQRPGNEVLGEFMMQKLKSPNGDLGGPMSLPLSPPLSGGLPALPPALPASGAKKSEAAGNNNSAKANNKNTKATAATNGVPTSIATSKAK